MKRLLILLIALMCFAPLASATVHNYNVTLNNEGEGLYSSLVISKANTQNITGIQSLVIEGCSPFFGRNPAYEKTGTFILKNQTNTTLGTGTYSTVYGDYKNDYCPYFGTITHTYTFSNYSNAYPSIVDTWTAFYSNQIGYYGNGAGSDPEPWKAVLTPNAAGNPSIAGGYTFTYIDLLEPAPVADFTALPTTGPAPLAVSFTDNSTNELGVCTYNWSITPIGGVSGATGTFENHLATFTLDGNYTVAHGLECFGKSDIETKTDFIQVMNLSALITTAFRATDGATGNRITGATIHLNDVENGSWSNSSTNLGVATITVLVGHHISAYANATGFNDGEYLNAPAMAWTYDIMMLPTGFANVSAGNVTAYITVTDADTLQKLYACQVNAAYATAEGSRIIEGTTNSAGAASFVLPNNTNVHFNAIKTGYEGAQLVLNTGTGSGGDAKVLGEIKLSKIGVTPTITATTLPGGGTPTPTQTYLRYCNPAASDYNEDACRTSENTGMMDQLREAGPSIIGLCIVAILMGLLKIIMG
jgi:PKD repeat protein